MTVENGVFTVSLDFELYWGVRDKRTIDQYRCNLLGVRNAIDELLQLFTEYGVHATWATVGFLFFRDVEQLKQNLPSRIPRYDDENLSPYQYIAANDDLEAAIHFAPEVIERIRNCEGQEIGSHTFCHYYCQEAGQSQEDFLEDLVQAVKIAEKRGISIKSFVFPRNDINADYLDVFRRFGILCYRGSEPTWVYQADGGGQQFLRRGLRLLDSYASIFGPQTYDIDECMKTIPFNFPSSRFLRPYSKKMRLFDYLRLKRITGPMEDAAIRHRLFHLWWHPHNFGVNTRQNIEFLRKILDHYKKLNLRYGFQSMNMGELSSLGLRSASGV